MNKTTDHKITSQKIASASAQETDWQTYVEDFRRAGHETVDWIAQYLNSVADMPVLAGTKPGDLLDSMPAVTQWNHPRFFAYFACTGSTPAILGEMLAAALNTNGLHWKTSPAVAE